MEIHPDAGINHFKSELTELVDYERGSSPTTEGSTNSGTINVSKFNQKIIKDTLLDVQNTCLSTINNLCSEKNIT